MPGKDPWPGTADQSLLLAALLTNKVYKRFELDSKDTRTTDWLLIAERAKTEATFVGIVSTRHSCQAA